MPRFSTLPATAVFAAGATLARMQNPTVGGAPMLPDRMIAENAVNSGDHETPVAAGQQAGLVEMLNSEGPFTVFAPTDAAFDRITDESPQALMMDRNREQQARILTCHVVSANAMSDAIAGLIAEDGGMHPVPAVGGGTLQAVMMGDEIGLTDENGRGATVTVADVRQSKGVIPVIDRALLPAQ